MLDHFGVTEDNWRDAVARDRHFALCETPLLVGRVIAAPAADPAVNSRAGQVLTCWDLAHNYDITDVDGAQPHWDEHLDVAIEEISSPSTDDLLLLAVRKPQLDFDTSRAGQRARIEAFFQEHQARGGDST